MTAIALKRETDSYWNLIKDAGIEVKLALIKKLSDALKLALAEINQGRRSTLPTTSPVCGRTSISWTWTN